MTTVSRNCCFNHVWMWLKFCKYTACDSRVRMFHTLVTVSSGPEKSLSQGQHSPGGGSGYFRYAFTRSSASGCLLLLWESEAPGEIPVGQSLCGPLEQPIMQEEKRERCLVGPLWSFTNLILFLGELECVNRCVFVSYTERGSSWLCLSLSRRSSGCVAEPDPLGYGYFQGQQG